VSEAERFRNWLHQATGHSPYHYQTRLATERDMPGLLRVPTGLGKTAAAIVAWLWRRRFADERVRAQTPRRLVYCLPMSVPGEQTHDLAVLWLHWLGLLAGRADSGGAGASQRVVKCTASWSGTERIVISALMAGEEGLRGKRALRRTVAAVGHSLELSTQIMRSHRSGPMLSNGAAALTLRKKAPTSSRRILQNYLQLGLLRVAKSS
jgi:CRISPR-associated endonuclease/helicase Cas3